MDIIPSGVDYSSAAKLYPAKRYNPDTANTTRSFNRKYELERYNILLITYI